MPGTPPRLAALLVLAAGAAGAACSSGSAVGAGAAPGSPVGPAPSSRPGALLTSSADLPVPAEAQRAVVVAETDGDTLRLRGTGQGPVPPESTRVRLLLVDAPEIFDQQQCYGPEAARRAAELVPVGTEVRVAGDVQERDRFGRPLVHVWRPDGVNLGAELVAEGYARVLQIDPNRRYLELFRQREREARSASRGLWGACG